MTSPESYYTVYTIGHSNLDAADLVAHLAKHAIETVVDVRAYPYSQYVPWFDRDKVEYMLSRAGLEYVWMGRQLGGMTAEGKLDYVTRERDPEYQESIKALMDLIASRRVAIMCSEGDFNVCHRNSLIAQTLMKHNIRVVHILTDSGTYEAEPDLFHG
jgi:uncharacterized protein (DUF488 family)